MLEELCAVLLGYLRQLFYSQQRVLDLFCHGGHGGGELGVALNFKPTAPMRGQLTSMGWKGEGSVWEAGMLMRNGSDGRLWSVESACSNFLSSVQRCRSWKQSGISL
jgi:hypothetical protein